MKKSIFLLTALSLLGSNTFAQEKPKENIIVQESESDTINIEYLDANLQESTDSFVKENKWTFIGRTYLESEDFDNNSPLTGGDDEDGTFWGTGISASKGKLTLDLNVEKRFGGDLSLTNSDAEWEATRVDWKVRYQLFNSQAFHIKYRNEERTRDYTKDTYHGDWSRDRYELGTDFNHFNNMLAGWFVVGYDKDKSSNFDQEKNILINSRDNGWYWEGDFGPTFKLTEKLSLNPTLYTTGEMYDSYEMVETQFRVMLPYTLNENITLMPRIRFTLDRQNDDSHGNKVWEYKAGDRIRYELLANINISENLSSFVGVAYENANRDIVGKGKKDIDLFWTYASLTYKFN